MSSKAMGMTESWIADGPPSQPGPATVEGGFNALNPADGLFLRAEHLQAMERYARDLAWAVGVGTGTGTVYGFEVEVDSAATALTVKPGLAMSAVGQPLRSTKAAVIALKADEMPPLTGPDGFWVVEVNPAWWTWGSENVYGNLCDEPCNGSGALAPWVAEGVTVSLRPDAIAGLGGVSLERRRNWLASRYFERERRAGGPWVVPSDSSGQVQPITGRDWVTGGGPPVRAGVPIAVLQLADDKWVLDVWTARRDIGGPPADDVWRWRLGMRPWNVFLAQVLQFQAHLADVGMPSAKSEKVAIVDKQREIAMELVEEILQSSKPSQRHQRFVKDWQAAPPPVAVLAEGKTLADQGFDELPPAGLLEVGAGEDLGPRLAEFFGPGVDLRLCHVRADYVMHAFEEAQHLDRIPLSSEHGTAAVDILVPDVSTEFGPLRAAGEYGWVAFVRRREADCGASPASERDVVDVYWLEVGQEALGSLRKNPSELIDRAKQIGQLDYPAGSWAYPAAAEVELELMQASKGAEALVVVAVVKDESRRPLGALRGSLLAASLDEGLPAPEVWSIASSDAPESIVVARFVAVVEPIG